MSWGAAQFVEHWPSRTRETGSHCISKGSPAAQDYDPSTLVVEIKGSEVLRHPQLSNN